VENSREQTANEMRSSCPSIFEQMMSRSSGARDMKLERED
jgi:hypothetical protein